MFQNRIGSFRLLSACFKRSFLMLIFARDQRYISENFYFIFPARRANHIRRIVMTPAKKGGEKMSEVHIRSGYTRSGFSMVYHEVFDLYHPYIGDTATLLYLYLLRSRNNEIGHPDMGKSWRGRKGITEKFRVAYKTLPTIDAILEASGLVRIERRKGSRPPSKSR